MDRANQHWVVVRSKAEFLRRLMVTLADGAMISLEGDLAACSFPESLVVPLGAANVPERCDPSDQASFVVLTLTAESVEPVFRQIMRAGLKRNVVHVQIMRDGQLELGAYDNFHPDCVVTGPGVGPTLLDELKAEQIVRSYEPRVSNGGTT